VEFLEIYAPSSRRRGSRAVRSSSLLETAGPSVRRVYGTRYPNNQPDATRASAAGGGRQVRVRPTFSARPPTTPVRRKPGRGADAVSFRRWWAAARRALYPDVSGVARSRTSTDGVGAPSTVWCRWLGPGETIVDGGVCCRIPGQRPTPAVRLRVDLVRNSQTGLAVNMGVLRVRPMAETEYLIESGLDAADYDGSFRGGVDLRRRSDACGRDPRAGARCWTRAHIEARACAQRGVAGLLEACAQRVGAPSRSSSP